MTLIKKLNSSVGIAPGTVVHLDFGQADARRHLITPLAEAHKDRADARRLPFRADQRLFFKAGEEIGVEGPLDRQLQAAMGLSDEQLVEAGAAKPGVKASVRASRRAKAQK